ncbi:sialoadhesin [Pleurodeles waltl]|uniref:sialoadhesin n=1 Tax=Pleurodeles waltl TaxID=8319 RepID=UPI0037093BE7
MFIAQLFWLATMVFQGCESSWDVLCPAQLKSVKGSCLLIPCEFIFPSDVMTPSGITPIWYQENDGQRVVVYHSTTTEIDGRFQGRTELLGDPNKKNCTLLIRNVAKEDAGNYVFRFEIDEVNRWLDKKGVTVTVTDDPVSPEITVPENVTDGSSITLNCITPYFCPDDSISLQWKDGVPEGAFISLDVQLDTSAVFTRRNLHTTVSWRDNQKMLRCEVSVGNSRAAKDVTLNVKHAPKGTEVVINPNTVNIKEGDSASMACNVNSSNPGITGYKWYKDENGEAFSTEQVVTIQSVARSDHGQYHCEVKNPIGTGVAQARTLTVFSARVLVSPSSEIREKETATLTCDVPGGEPEKITYSWYKNNIWLKEGPARVLLFHEALSSDTGYYACKVQNDKGSDTSPPIAITVVYPPRMPVLTSFLETQEGKLAIVHCTVDSEPAAELALERNGKVIATTSSHGAPNQRLTVSSSRNSLKLEIRGVVLDDEGTYVCCAKNVYGNSTTSRNFRVETAKVLISPSAEVREGETVTMTCMATRSEDVVSRYVWFKNTKWLKESSERSLIFEAVASGDAGSYNCKSESKDGSATSPPRTLTVRYAPRKPLISSFLEMQGRQLGIIECSVDSDPISEIALYRKDVLVASTSLHTLPNQRISISSSHNSLKLEIQGVGLEDEGQYICSANNTYGIANSSIDFTAETVGVTIRPSAEILEGEAVTLTCMLSHDSKDGNNYTWYKNNEWHSESTEAALVFQQVASQDTGSYYCKVWSNERRKSSPPVSLNVFYAPRNTLVKSYLETGEGKLAFIFCTTESNPLSRITMYRRDEQVASSDSQAAADQRLRVTTSRNALKIDFRGVMVEDEGMYRCDASNAHGTSSQSLYFRVQTARVLVMPPTDIQEGDTVTLTCEATSSVQDEVSYIWYKNSRWYLEDSVNSLVFQQIRSHDTGFYHCRARDKDGSSTSPSVNVQVLYGPRNLTMSSFLEMQDGQLGIIQCSVDSNPPSEIALYRDDALVASTSSHGAPSQRLSIAPSLNSLKLEIRNIMFEDEGTYMCFANNTHGNAESQLIFSAESARIVVDPSTEVLEGNTVTLTCSVSSNAPGVPAYTWYKNGNWYKQGTDKTLRLKSVASDDSGSYYCKVQTLKGSKSSSSVSLNILYPPRNAWIRSFLETSHGKLAILQCAVSSNPPSVLRLLKDDAPWANTSLQEDSSQRLAVSYSQNFLRLEIRNVMTEDEGTYTCSATNAYGTTTASAYFAVEGARVLINRGASVQEGETVTLTCDVTTTAHLVTHYVWYRNSKWLLEGSASSLVLQDVTSEDVGSYSCEAQSNEGSRVSPPVTLQVLFSPRQPLMVSFLETQRGNLGIIRCSVESDPPSNIAIYRAGEVVASSGLRSSPNQRISVYVTHNSLQLEIKDVVLDDQGEYECAVNNTYGSATTSTYFTVETARVTAEPSPELPEGDLLNLTCVTTSEVQGTANYTWFKNNRWLQASTEASLVLHRVTSIDTGSYHCQVEDTEASRTSTLIGINVLYAPRDLQASSFLETQGGRLGIIQCSVDSAPASVLTLYKNDEPVASTSSHSTWDPRLRISSSYNSLRLAITEAKVEYSANYVCTANNTLGSTTASLYFNVQAAEEVYFYKSLAWVAIVTATCLLLLIAVLAGKTWKRKLEFSKLDTEDNIIEMTSKKEEPQPGDAN